jgi:hypothetical protein
MYSQYDTQRRDNFTRINLLWRGLCDKALTSAPSIGNPLRLRLLRFHLQDIKHPIQTLQLSVCNVLHILISIITLVVLHVLHVLQLLTTFKLTTIQETGQVSIGNLVPSVRLLWHSNLFDLLVTPQLFKPCDRTMQVACRAPHWHWQIWLEGVFSIPYFTLVNSIVKFSKNFPVHLKGTLNPRKSLLARGGILCLLLRSVREIMATHKCKICSTLKEQV